MWSGRQLSIPSKRQHVGSGFYRRHEKNHRIQKSDARGQAAKHENRAARIGQAPEQGSQKCKKQSRSGGLQASFPYTVMPSSHSLLSVRGMIFFKVSGPESYGVLKCSKERKWEVQSARIRPRERLRICACPLAVCLRQPALDR